MRGDEGGLIFGEGSFGGALSLAWWEWTGRCVLALWFGPQGIMFAAGGILRVLGGSSPLAWTGIVTAGIGAVFILLAVQSMRGRLGLVGGALVVLLAGVISAAMRNGGPRDLSGRSAWVDAADATLCLLGLLWIASRRRARSERFPGVQKGIAALLSVSFIVALPAQGWRLGTGTGMLLAPPEKVVRLSAGQRIPQGKFVSIDGRSVELNAPGVVYVVNFWATWCGPCRKELPHLLALAREWPADAPVRLMAVNTENLDPSALASFLETERLQGLPVFADPDGYNDLMGVDTIPTTFLIRDREVISRHSGYGEDLIPALRDEIRRGINRGQEGEGDSGLPEP